MSSATSMSSDDSADVGIISGNYSESYAEDVRVLAHLRAAASPRVIEPDVEARAVPREIDTEPSPDRQLAHTRASRRERQRAMTNAESHERCTPENARAVRFQSAADVPRVVRGHTFRSERTHRRPLI